MGNIFDEAQNEREKDQIKKQNANMGKIRKKGRTTTCISLTEEDKRKLQMYAVARGETVSAVIHGWIRDFCE